MRLPVILLSHFAYYVYAFSIPVARLHDFVSASHAQKQQQPLQETLETWIEIEERVALDKLLANVAPGGRNVQGKGVVDGTVVASPSQDEPDYWYQCTSTFV